MSRVRRNALQEEDIKIDKAWIGNDLDLLQSCVQFWEYPGYYIRLTTCIIIIKEFLAFFQSTFLSKNDKQNHT